MSQEIEKLLWDKVSKYGKVLQIVPFVRFIAVCNSLSFSKVHKDSDIDLFVVSRPGRLFIVRTFVTFLVHFSSVRRYKDKIAERFCLSFFIDESASDLSNIAISEDYYLAYWTANLKPIIDYNFEGLRASKIFLDKNIWIKDYFVDYQNLSISDSRLLLKSKFLGFLRGLFSILLFGYIGDFVEFVLKSWQLPRAKKKAEMLSDEASIVLKKNILKFHNKDRRKFYHDRLVDTYPDYSSFISSDFYSVL